MEYINKTSTFFLLKSVIYAVGFLSLIGISRLWIGSNENWNQMIENECIPALIVRSIFFGGGRITIYRVIIHNKQDLQEREPFFERIGCFTIVFSHAECNNDVRHHLT
ncbi:hypothetical protein [Chryseobacterium indologenes]|uniref:hypothetical protein n=1 Tax=Chryseobacterium indologenes TaxID=253 RepID=UPI00301890B0